MKNLILFINALALICISSSYAEDHCYSKSSLCTDTRKLETICNSKYSAANKVSKDLQAYVLQHIINNYSYLQMSTVFSSYRRNRAGFEKLYKKLADESWSDGIDLIKYLSKRGEKFDFNGAVTSCTKTEKTQPAHCNMDVLQADLDELQSLSKALDLHKYLAKGAHAIHSQVARRNDEHHDPEVGSYIENNFVHKHADTIRSLAGHFNDLLEMLRSDKQEQSLSVYLFDEYLSKIV